MKTSVLIAANAVVADACLVAFAFYSLSRDMWGLSLIAIMLTLVITGWAIEALAKVKW